MGSYLASNQKPKTIVAGTIVGNESAEGHGSDT